MEQFFDLKETYSLIVQNAKKSISITISIISYSFLVFSIISTFYFSIQTQELLFHMFLITWGLDKVLAYSFNQKLYLGPYLTIPPSASKPIRIIGLLAGLSLIALGTWKQFK